MATRFEAKVVVITGASSGIGAAAARQFASQGARIALMARTASALEAVAEEIRARGGKARAYPLDVRDIAACDATLASIEAELGGIDILVNNAGANFRGPVEVIARKNWPASWTSTCGADRADAPRSALPSPPRRRRDRQRRLDRRSNPGQPRSDVFGDQVRPAGIHVRHV
jgi:NAD(P)-dependent dehydrogenase (short-subunit alcohol dehydrogenase family)